MHFGRSPEKALPWLVYAGRLANTKEQFDEIAKYDAAIEQLKPDLWRAYQNGRLKIPMEYHPRSIAALTGVSRGVRERKASFSGYEIDTSGPLAVKRDVIDVSRAGDYGADPIGDGRFKMVPSGDIVDFDERNRRLKRPSVSEAAHEAPTLTEKEWGIWDATRGTWTHDPLTGSHRPDEAARFQSQEEAERFADRNWRALNPGDKFEVRRFSSAAQET